MFFAKHTAHTGQSDSATKSRSLNRQMLVLLIGLVIIFIVAQFAILATLGTKGTEIARVRIQMEKLRVENEDIRAQIDKSKTDTALSDEARQNLNLRTAPVERISDTDTDTVGFAR